MVKDNRLSQVLVIFLGITLLGSSFTAFSSPVLAAGPGTFIADFVSSGSGGMNNPTGLEFGPDGNLYVGSWGTDEVLRYDGTTGSFIDAFVSSGSGGMNNPTGLEFGPDGNLYVSSYSTDEVLRYDGTTGSFIDAFVSSGSGGMNTPKDPEFGPDGNLYVSSYQTDEVLRYDGTTGSFIDIFASGGGMNSPVSLEFGPDGNLYVSSSGTDEVLRYDGTTGSFIDIFASGGGMNTPKGMEFGPDGNLYVGSWDTDEVLRYDGTTGAFIDAYVSAGSGGLVQPSSLSFFGPDENLYVSSWGTNEVLRYEGPFGVSITCNGKTVEEWEALGYTKFVGTSGDDSITGTSGNDVIAALGGDNVIDSKEGDDIICSDAGDDVINAGLGDDFIDAGDGNNDVQAGDGDNYIVTGTQDDVIQAGSGDDTIFAGDGNNDVQAGDGDNDITTGTQDDVIQAGSGDDCVDSGTGSDSIDAGSGTNLVDIGTCPPIDNPPIVAITAPSDGSSFLTGSSVTFIGTANDVEDGNLNASLNWTSDLDGVIGAAGAFSTSTLSIGTHMITASVTDSFGNTASLTHTITVNPIGTPTVSISAPVDGDSFEEGTLITLSGNALDPEDGDLSASITWTSDVYGVIGSGASISSSTVPIGFHIITASVTDSDGNIGSNSIVMTVTPPILANPPTVSITSPINGDIFDESILVSFQGTASDPEDGDLTASISWNSDFDGAFGLGGSLSMSSLATETHVITASITDSDGNTSTDSITITVSPAGLTQICHLPPGNPSEYHELMISPSALVAHVVHGDYEGVCETDEEVAKKKAIISLIKKQTKETREKNELKEKRHILKEIKHDLRDLKNILHDEEKLKVKILINDIKEVIKNLKEDPEYDKEHKKIIKNEIKEIKREIIHEIKSDGKISKHKIDSKISKLSKSDNPKYTAKKLGLDFENGKTQIAIELSGKDPAVVELLSSIGRIDAKDDNHVQLTIKLSDLPKLRALGGIENIRPPFPAVQFEEELSEGVYFINADLAQFVGITGQGIKAAVLDLAFTDNPKISDNVVEVKSFRQGIGYLPIQGNEDEALHGTAVAEIISDVAPDVQLYLYSMETDIEFASAVDEAISQQVDIIVMSAGWPNFPTDGTSHITKKIEHAVDSGITFVVPAGNFANKHWEGTFVDSNMNNWHEFSNSDEGLSIAVTEERIAEEKPIIAHLMWDVGMGDVEDFELVLVDPLGQIVDYSANQQKTKSDTSIEYIYHVPDIDGTYSIGVLYAGDISSPSEIPSATLEIFSVNDELEHPITKSSVSVPADANGAIVVGAVNHLDGTLESFSSQGPTNNGKLVPHVVGPDGVTTLSLDGSPFFGTSATAPYIAGLAALIIQTNPDITPEELLEVIQQNTDPSLFSLQNEFDYSYGYGSANAIFLLEEPEVLE